MTDGGYDATNRKTSRLRVFISYSRDDLYFADQLAAALGLHNFEVAIDRHRISGGEDWQSRLSELIRDADTVVFVLSSSSAGSDICKWEVEQALRLGKRIIPVLCRPLEGVNPPPRLAGLNYIFFYPEPRSPGSGFGSGLVGLVKALNTEIEWLREHTRLLQRAAEWDAGGRPSNRLLSGGDIDEAKSWAATRPKDAPQPTDLHLDFIRASEEAENQRLNAERQRLELMAAAQDEREKALEREKVALLQVENALRQAQAAARNRQRAQNAIWVLFACIIAGLVGWINQAALKEQWQWYTVLRPYMLAKFKPYVLTAHAEGVLQPAKAFRECEAKCPEMIVVPAGRFAMGSLNELGSEDERPAHNVTMTRPFAIGKYEVTVDEWNACVSVGACPSPPGTQGATPRAPVANVSWGEARLYVAWLSRMTGKEYRLLTEREWEYSARANTTTTYSFGDDSSLICRFANIADATLRRSVPPSWQTADCSDGHLGVAPVGSYQPNSFGLYDLHGNVWEWVEDCYGPYNETDYALPLPSDSCPRVLRGGGFDSVPDLARSSNRNWAGPGTRQDAYGFRVARTLARQ